MTGHEWVTMSEKNNFIFYCEQNLQKQKEEKETELFIDHLLTGDWLSDFHFQELFTDLTLHTVKWIMLAHRPKSVENISDFNSQPKVFRFLWLFLDFHWHFQKSLPLCLTNRKPKVYLYIYRIYRYWNVWSVTSTLMTHTLTHV